MLDIPTIIKVLIIVAVSFTATTGNVLAITIFLRNGRLRTLSNMLVLSLEICDLLFSSVVMPSSAFEISVDHTRPVNRFICGLTAHFSCSLVWKI